MLLIGLLALLVCWAAWEVRTLANCDFGRVKTGVHAGVLHEDDDPDRAVTRLVADAIGGTANRGPRTLRSNDDEPARGTPDTGTPTRDVGDVAVPGLLAAATGVGDWLHVDRPVLDAFEQLTHEHISNGLDLWRTISGHDYNKMHTPGFDIKLRGHVGEQQVYDQLRAWAGDDLSVPDASNAPAADLTLGGHDFNVKVGASTSAIAEHLRTHPDIPVIVNADMANLPADALHVDLTQAIDPDVLAAHSVVVADGLLMSDLHDQMADALGPVLDGFDAGDLLAAGSDLAVPVLGSAIRVVRSGMRERKLVEHHGDRRRAAANVASDVTIVGGSVMAGGAFGLGLGMLIDAGSMGATAGLGTTLIGPTIGSMLGGLWGNQEAAGRRMKPLTDARTAAGQATLAYDAAVTEAVGCADKRWRTEILPTKESELEAIATSLRTQVDRAARDAHQTGRRADEAATTAAINALQLLITTSSHQRDLSLLAARRRATWRRRATEAIQHGDFGELLDVLLAARSARPVVEELLSTRSRRRAVALAAAVTQGQHAVRLATIARNAALSELAASQQQLGGQVERSANAPALAVWHATRKVRDELVATGAKRPEWVKENLPVPDKPRLSAQALATSRV